jgi:predicted glycosyltransferase
LLIQFPRILWAIYAEHRLIRRWLKTYQFDGIITDNRLGCFASGIPTVFITHQLNLEAPGTWLKRFTNGINHWFIRKFDYCWVPDAPGDDNLSGVLSRPSPAAKTRYVGPLSRLHRVEVEPAYDVMMLLSGPEPQRTYLEKALRKQAATLPYRMLLVQGKPELNTAPVEEGRLRIIPFLDEAALEQAIASATLLVCRSGYSTLMDLAVMGKRALLIPTPGQTEQAYLAQYLSNRGMYIWQDQHHLALEKGIAEVLALPAQADQQQAYATWLAEAMDEFLAHVISNKNGGA